MKPREEKLNSHFLAFLLRAWPTHITDSAIINSLVHQCRKELPEALTKPRIWSPRQIAVVDQVRSPPHVSSNSHCVRYVAQYKNPRHRNISPHSIPWLYAR